MERQNDNKSNNPYEKIDEPAYGYKQYTEVNISEVKSSIVKTFEDPKKIKRVKWFCLISFGNLIFALLFWIFLFVSVGTFDNILDNINHNFMITTSSITFSLYFSYFVIFAIALVCSTILSFISAIYCHYFISDFKQAKTWRLLFALFLTAGYASFHVFIETLKTIANGNKKTAN
ncbi:hypothetical protein [[Mycoplasma] testudinis]|uniref:hypothetical protein n=1 Tax=[Mycoplasma] testudinis TaxID=33924 RepID=UPI0004895A15|nr:hypothetical protein [[Mycoplasma] testudinis]